MGHPVYLLLQDIDYVCNKLKMDNTIFDIDRDIDNCRGVYYPFNL